MPNAHTAIRALLRKSKFDYTKYFLMSVSDYEYCYLIYMKLVSAQSKYYYLKWNPTLIPDRNMLKQSEAGWTEKLLLAL